jgi:zinc/manganese transport system ATP-binding protein
MVNLDNLTVSYRQHPALHHITGQFERGSLTAVVGPNGAGKSTLLKSIMALQPIASGQLTLAEPHARLAYLPQLAEIDRSFPINVQDCVLLGCWPASGAWGHVGGALQAKAVAALNRLGLTDFAKRPISTLSAGQLQRTLFARLLLQDADVILLDEPFNAIDSKTTAALLNIVEQWHQQSRTVIAVLHDELQVRQYFPQTLLLAREVVAWGNTAQVLTEPHLRQARAMAEAWDESAEICRIDGQRSLRKPPHAKPQSAHKATA